MFPPSLAPRRLAHLTASAVAVGMLSSCGAGNAVGARYSREFSCPLDDVRVSGLGSGAYRARGCGGDVTYVCITGGWGQTLCTTDAVRSQTSPRPPAASPEPHRASAFRRSQIVSAFEPAGDAILACIPNATLVELRLYVLADGRLYDFRAPRQLELPAWRCVRAALDARRAPAAPGPLRVVTSVAFRSSPPALPEPGSSGRADIGTTELRAWRDSQRDVILTCAERPTALVHARWDADGMVTLGFGGDLAGTEADGCMESALGVHHTTARAPGALSHVLR